MKKQRNPKGFSYPFVILFLLCVAMVVGSGPNAIAADSGGFLGRVLGQGDEDTPTPPVPPLGKTVQPVIVHRPLPAPIPGPAIPALEGNHSVNLDRMLNDFLDSTSLKTEVEAELELKTELDPQGETSSADASPLSPELRRLREQIEDTLARYRQALPIQDSTPASVMRACVAFGGDTELVLQDRTQTRINAIGALCWNYACGGQHLLVASEGDFMPRLGHGLQSKRSEFLFTLAMASISRENELRIASQRGTVDDLIDWEQRNIHSGMDHSLTLYGLSHYLDEDASWTSSRGEEWTLDRLAGTELNRDVPVTHPDAVDRLLGLTRYVIWARKHNVQRSARHRQVERYLARFNKHALKLQDHDGSWGAHYFGYREPSTSSAFNMRRHGLAIEQERLGSTGNILLWLTKSMTVEQLRSPELARAAHYVNSGLAQSRNVPNTRASSAFEYAMTMRSITALSQYKKQALREPESRVERK